jgi:hypothetical protein
MKKVIVGAAALIGAVATLHRFAPTLHKRAMKKCREMMSHQGCPPSEERHERATPEDVSTGAVFAAAQRK